VISGRFAKAAISLSLEVYTNERLASTYPTREDSTGVMIDAIDGAARLLDLRI
jgi:hypothetical protein